jgi:hypothetical protein
MQDAISNLQSYATTPGVDPAGLDALVGSYQAMNPALAKPKYDQGLDAAVGSLQPLVSGGGTGNITMEEAQQVSAEAAGAVEQMIPLHEARNAYMNLVRATGVDGATHDRLFDLFGQAYAAKVSPLNEDIQTKLLNAPITGATPGLPGAAPSAAPAGTGGPGILEQLMGGDTGMALASMTGGMTTAPQLLAGLPAVGDDLGRLAGGFGGQIGGAAADLASRAATPTPQGPSRGKLEDLLRMLTGSLSSSMTGNF